MDLALTQSFIKSQNENSLHFSSSFSQSNLNEAPSEVRIENFHLKDDDNCDEEKGDNLVKQVTTADSVVSMSKSVVSLNRVANNMNDNGDNNADCEKINQYDQYQFNDQVKFLLHDINQSLNSKLKGFTLDHNKSSQVTVYVYLVFLKISEIDTVKERFQADAYIESYWHDNTIDTNVPYDPRKHWNPDLHVENAIGEVKQEIRYKTKNINGVCRIHEIRNLKGGI